MARQIGAQAKEMWRVVEVCRNSEGGLWYFYYGMYAKEGTAKAFLTRLRNGNQHHYDGWVERCEVKWETVKD